jgi:hypothetical protein
MRKMTDEKAKTKFNRCFDLPSAETFTIKSIKSLLIKYNVGKEWIDPFAGRNSPAEITNDHNPVMPTKYHLEALDFVKLMKGQSFNGVLFDPPYSYRQVSEHYKVIGKKATRLDTSSNFYARVLNPLSKLIRPNGICISFGWNSNGMGKNRGFEIIEILLVAHGGHHNDTIVTVEKKIQKRIGEII